VNTKDAGEFEQFFVLIPNARIGRGDQRPYGQVVVGSQVDIDDLSRLGRSG
jgi:hypothetical protein